MVQLGDYTASQINRFFPDPQPVDAPMLRSAIGWTFERLFTLHRHAVNKYYFRNGEPYFDYLHGDQYATYIYFLSRYFAAESINLNIAAKLYLLNKALFALDIFYEVKLPEIFLLCHPVGTVLGRASYQDYLVVLQNCTVGNIDNVYPALGRGVVLYAGSSVLGASELGDSVCVGAGSLLVDLRVPPNHTVIGRAKDARFFPCEKAGWKNFYHADDAL